MQELGLTYSKAWKLVLIRRPIAQPNIFFATQLKAFEAKATTKFAEKQAAKLKGKAAEEAKFSPTEAAYCCGKCRTPLFRGDALNAHQRLPKAEDSKAGGCSAGYFVEVQPWMRISKHADSGSIVCPNKKVLSRWRNLSSVTRRWDRSAGRG